MTEKEKNQEEKVYTKIEHDGVIKDLQKERSDRQEATSNLQEATFNLDQSRRENESLKKRLVDLEAKPKETELISDKMEFSGEDDEPVTVKEVKRGFKNLEKDSAAKAKTALKAAKASADHETLMENFDKSLRLATEKYYRLKDIGLDFQTVYRSAIKRIGRNRYEEAAVLHSTNPGERLYEIGSKDPEIKAKLDLEENQELLKSMETRKVDKDSLTGGGEVKKSDEFFTPQEVSAMKIPEAAKVLPKIEKSRKHWQELRENKK